MRSRQQALTRSRSGRELEPKPSGAPGVNGVNPLTQLTQAGSWSDASEKRATTEAATIEAEPATRSSRRTCQVPRRR